MQKCPDLPDVSFFFLSGYLSNSNASMALVLFLVEHGPRRTGVLLEPSTGFARPSIGATNNTVVRGEPAQWIVSSFLFAQVFRL